MRTRLNQLRFVPWGTVPVMKRLLCFSEVSQATKQACMEWLAASGRACLLACHHRDQTDDPRAPSASTETHPSIQPSIQPACVTIKQWYGDSPSPASRKPWQRGPEECSERPGFPSAFPSLPPPVSRTPALRPAKSEAVGR